MITASKDGSIRIWNIDGNLNMPRVLSSQFSACLCFGIWVLQSFFSRPLQKKLVRLDVSSLIYVTSLLNLKCSVMPSS